MQTCGICSRIRFSAPTLRLLRARVRLIRRLCNQPHTSLHRNRALGLQREELQNTAAPQSLPKNNSTGCVCAILRNVLRQIQTSRANLAHGRLPSVAKPRHLSMPSEGAFTPSLPSSGRLAPAHPPPTFGNSSHVDSSLALVRSWYWSDRLSKVREQYGSAVVLFSRIIPYPYSRSDLVSRLGRIEICDCFGQTVIGTVLQLVQQAKIIVADAEARSSQRSCARDSLLAEKHLLCRSVGGDAPGARVTSAIDEMYRKWLNCWRGAGGDQHSIRPTSVTVGGLPVPGPARQSRVERGNPPRELRSPFAAVGTTLRQFCVLRSRQHG
jgi:hypothetical protein